MKKTALFFISLAAAFAALAAVSFGGELYAVEGEPVFAVRGESYYARVCSVDANGDGKLTATDARAVLRHSAKLEMLTGDEADYDADLDGRVTAADARLLLRISSKLAVLYCKEDGSFETGLLECDDGTVRCLNKSGEALKGMISYDDEIIYIDSSDMLRDGLFKDGSNTYYIADGEAKSGLYDFEGETYYFEGGKAATGERYIDHDLYFFSPGGEMLKNTTRGAFTIGADGRASASALNAETLEYRLHSILKRYGDSYTDIYNYMGAYTYAVKPNDTQENLMLNMLSTGRGSCYHYAALTKGLLEAAGYEAYTVDGRGMHGTGEHKWVLVKVDGAWRHMDTQYSVYRGVSPILMTDSLASARGYYWYNTDLPAAV